MFPYPQTTRKSMDSPTLHRRLATPPANEALTAAGVLKPPEALLPLAGDR